jgi:Ca2+-binding EF-hand superfamily protein/catechol 2,3-dioxygenase-like lactoylglutathione lyase family enzyme
MADYYDQPFKLHWDPKVHRAGLGTLLTKVNHIAIIVSDINKSLAFYVEVLGLQQIRRPNFDRHGAWLTLGNVELHLIKGNPVVHEGDNLIVPHISVESDNIGEVLEKLVAMKVPFSKNVSVPDSSESKPITQFFIRDPDGYYIELCNCDILTNFCLGKDKVGIRYNEIVQQVEMSHIFKLAFLAQQSLDASIENESILVPPENEWAQEVDAVKLHNLLSRCKIYADLMQGETEETIGLALKQANNKVPLATKIIRARKRGKEMFIPPAFFVQGEEKYQPSVYVAPKHTSSSDTVSQKKAGAHDHNSEEGQHGIVVNGDHKSPVEGDSYLAIVKKTFKHFDVNGDGVLCKEEFAKVLSSLRQNANSPAFAKIFSREDQNDDGVIDFEEFLLIIKDQPPVDALEHWEAFFNLLDIDGNGKITCPEMAMVIREMNFGLHDSHIENLFIEADEDGNGSLTIEELRNFFLN